MCCVCNDTVCAHKKTKSVSIRSVVLREILVAYYKNHKQRKYSLCGQREEFSVIKLAVRTLVSATVLDRINFIQNT